MKLINLKIQQDQDASATKLMYGVMLSPLVVAFLVTTSLLITS